MTVGKSNAIDFRTLNLGGAWNYELDYEDKGIAERWYDRNLYNSGFILPGTTATNHIGEALDIKPELSREAVRCLRQEFRYIGAAWYQKKIEIPEQWKDKMVYIFLERVMFGSTLWINGSQVGAQDSLSAPHVYDITEYIESEREYIVTLRIDNRDIQNIGPYPSAYTDETQTIWNGVVGKMELIAKDRVNIDNIQVYPEVSSKSIKVKVDINNSYKNQVEAELKVRVFDKNDKTIFFKPRSKLNYVLEDKSSQVEFECWLDNDITEWNEFTPALYRLETTLTAVSKDDIFNDAKTVVFGMREFKTEGTQFIINNKKTFLRGTLECCIFPETGFPPTDKTSWLKIFNTIKDYGLNHLRFHSWCPPEAAFEGADEAGVYLCIEAPMWMDTWTGYAVGSREEHYSYLPKEAQRIVDTYGNHPSFCMFSNGNELNGDFKLLHDMVVELKKRDSRRVYTLTTNWDRKADEDDDFFAAQTVDGVGVRGQYFLDKMVEGTTLEYSEAVKLRNMPIVSHEVGQYSVYPSIDEIPLYSGVLKPINFEAIKNDLISKNMLKYARDFTLGSGKLATLLYKDEIEAALRTGGFGGFQLLDLHDFPGQSTATVGLLNSFWKSKGIIEAEEFRQFCYPIVPLMVTEKRIFSSDEAFNAEIKLCNYSDEVLKDVSLFWEISFNNGNVFAKGKGKKVFVEQGELKSVASIENLDFNKIQSAVQLIVTMGIEDTNIKNKWQIWVYPKEDTVQDSKDIIITNKFDQETENYLNQGRRVLLLPEVSQLKEVYSGKFFPVFWSPVHFVSKDPCGIICKRNHPVFKDFPTDSYASYQWKKPLENSFTMCIDSFSEDFEPLVQIVPNFYNNHRMTNLFEAKVDKGKIIVCSINFADARDKNIEILQLYKSILSYMNSENYEPENELSIDNIKDLFKDLDNNLDNKKEVDLAKGKSASSDSEKSSTYSAFKGNDGNPTTCWCAADAEAGHFWQVDLGELYQITGTRVIFTEEANYLYVIKVSDDDENWRLVINETGNTKTNKVREDMFKEKCRFVRIVYNGLPSGIWASHCSFQVLSEANISY